MAGERSNGGEPQQEYMSIDEAATELRVSRTNLYYYARQLPHIELKKFSLDRKTYISRSDVERIKVAKGMAAGSSRIATDDVLVFLAGLGLSITPHSDPSYGWGYSWFGGDWDGPYPTSVDALRAAFELADAKAQRLRDMPFPTRVGELCWWDGATWFGARHKEGKLEIQTFDQQENDGYELVQDVIAQREAWLQPADPTDDSKVDEERERARLAALWLTAGLRELQYAIDFIDWRGSRLQADVTVNGIAIGDLLDVYNHYREDNFLAWLHARLANRHISVGRHESEQE
ncbi:MAG: helix-turn-helix domain-containing protein [Ktedonobacteraceae bacterium]